MQKKGKIDNDERKAKICEVQVNSIIDFGKMLYVYVFEKLIESVSQS